jgi:large subunit ribosomal protein L24
MPQLKLKKGDTVKMLAGRDKGKTGKVVAVDRKDFSITVEGINLITRFQRAKKAGQKGQRVRLPASFSPSKVMVVCPNCGKTTRVGFEQSPEGKKLRKCKKCLRIFN